MLRMPPSLVVKTTRCAMKSKSICNVRSPLHGIGPVVMPRAVRYKVTCANSGSGGARAKPDLTDDLRIQLKGVAGVLPSFKRQRRPEHLGHRCISIGGRGDVGSRPFSELSGKAS